MKKTQKTKRKYLSPFTVIASLAVVVLAAVVLCGYISLNELTISVNKKQKEHTELVGANALLEAQIERKYSLSSIEQLATEQFNMIKLQSHQIHTVNLAETDSVEISGDGDKDTVFDGIIASFNILLEYLN